MQKLTFVLVGVLLSFSLMSCETVKGIGKDIQNTGDNIQDVVDRSYDGV